MTPSVTTIAWRASRARFCGSSCRGWSNGTRGERSWRKFIVRTLAGARVELQEGGAACERVDHLFVVYVDDRDAVRARLEERGVQTGIHYPLPIHLQKPYQALGYQRGDFPQAERACERVISMPLYPEMSDEQAAYAARTLREIVGEKVRNGRDSGYADSGSRTGMNQRHRFAWMDLLWLAFLGGLAVLPPRDGYHPQTAHPARHWRVPNLRVPLPGMGSRNGGAATALS